MSLTLAPKSTRCTVLSSGYNILEGSNTAYQEVLIRASRLKKVMADKVKKSRMETFVPNDKAYYYSGITSITINVKNAYELKGKILDDLHNNAFSGTNRKDAEVILFYNGLGIPTRQILDSRGAIPSKTVADAKIAIQEMAEYSQKWHNGTSRLRSTETSDGLAAIQAQLNNLVRQIKKVNEKVYAAQVGCEQCKEPHYTKDCPLKEEGKTLEEAYYTKEGLEVYLALLKRTREIKSSRFQLLLKLIHARYAVLDPPNTSKEGKKCEKNYSSVRRYVADPVNCMKKVEPLSRSKAIEDIISSGSFMEALVLNHCALENQLLSVSLLICLGKHDCEERISSVLIEYLVDISKRRAFWNLNEDILKIYYSDYQYAVSIKEDTCPYSKKPPIRREKEQKKSLATHSIIEDNEVLIRASRLKKVMADKEKNSSMETFAPNDKADYYSRITRIIVNWEKFYDKKENSLALWDTGQNGSDEIEVSDNESSDLEEYRIDPDLLTKDIIGFKTYEDYKNDWIYEWKENVPWVYDKPWLDNGIWKEPKPVKHTCKPFNYKTRCSEWPTCSWREDGYCNRGNFPGPYHIGNSLHYQDLECYEALEDSELKDEALRNKAMIVGKDGRAMRFTTTIMMKGNMKTKLMKKDMKEYVAVKEDEYDDLTITSDEACRAYQEIFRMMDEGWMVTGVE
ncbi:hypothetical protein Tco_0716660 [Tanacetum coccineum]